MVGKPRHRLQNILEAIAVTSAAQIRNAADFRRPLQLAGIGWFSATPLQVAAISGFSVTPLQLAAISGFSVAPLQVAVISGF
jgi:hypothetical protein